MENEARIRSEIRNALEPVVRTAPWLEDRIRDSIRGQSKRRGFRGMTTELRGWPAPKALVAALLLLAVIAAFIVGSRALVRPHDVPVKPNPAVQRYRTVVDRDFAELERLVAHGIPGTCNQVRAQTCRMLVLQAKDAAQTFLADLSEIPVPAGLESTDARLHKGLGDVVVALNAVLSDLDRNDFDAYAEDSSKVFFTKLQEVYPALIAVDCWPRAAIDANDPEGYSRLTCG